MQKKDANQPRKNGGMKEDGTVREASISLRLVTIQRPPKTDATIPSMASEIYVFGARAHITSFANLRPMRVRFLWRLVRSYWKENE